MRIAVEKSSLPGVKLIEKAYWEFGQTSDQIPIIFLLMIDIAPLCLRIIGKKAGSWKPLSRGGNNDFSSMSSEKDQLNGKSSCSVCCFAPVISAIMENASLKWTPAASETPLVGSLGIYVILDRFQDAC